MGVEISLQEYLKELGIKIILSKDDLLDLKNYQLNYMDR